MLRPAFTQQLADHLLSGKSVNLHAPHGRGRRQTLEDVLSLLSGVQVQKIDLKREQNKWNSWLKETLTLSAQGIVIIHNIEHMTSRQREVFNALRKFTVLSVSEQVMNEPNMVEIEIPELT